jgi:hypothetical protein
MNLSINCEGIPVKAVSVSSGVRPEGLVGACRLATACFAHASTHGITKALLPLSNLGHVGVCLLLQDGDRQVQRWKGKKAHRALTWGSSLHAAFVCRAKQSSGRIHSMVHLGQTSQVPKTPEQHPLVEHGAAAFSRQPLPKQCRHWLGLEMTWSVTAFTLKTKAGLVAE